MQRSMMYAVAVLMLAAASLVAVVRADLPIHCLNLHVAGAWTFSLSAANGTSTATTCGYLSPDTNAQHFVDTSVFDFDVESTYQVVLARPAIAYDSDGNYGTWTMIYDEGFEVRINGRVFFAFMKYSANSGVDTSSNSEVSSYTSDCSATMTGWYRNDDNSDWGCWSGVKYTETELTALAPSLSFSWAKAEDVAQTTAISSQVGLATEHVVSQTTELFKQDHKFVARINSDKRKTWTAKVHKQFDGKTVKEMMTLSGAARSRKVLSTTRKERQAARKAAARKAARAKRTSQRVLHSLSSLSAQESYGSLPETFDWRDVDGVNYVTDVVNQGSCGSCYAVATAAALESRFRVSSNMSLQPYLSAQEILSCSITNQGCEGGYPYLVSKHALEQGLVETWAFAYSGADLECSAPALDTAPRWRVSDYGYIGGFYGNGSEVAMMQEMYNNGPIIVTFESPTALFYYEGGVFDGECSLTSESEDSDLVRQWEGVNHAVVGVGWGVENGVKYWTIKNTWGSSWGESGYFRIIRGVDECAVESMASFATPLITDDLTSRR